MATLLVLDWVCISLTFVVGAYGHLRGYYFWPSLGGSFHVSYMYTRFQLDASFGGSTANPALYAYSFLLQAAWVLYTLRSATNSMAEERVEMFRTMEQIVHDAEARGESRARQEGVVTPLQIETKRAESAGECPICSIAVGVSERAVCANKHATHCACHARSGRTACCVCNAPVHMVVFDPDSAQIGPEVA